MDRAGAGRPRSRRHQGRVAEGDDTRGWGPPFIERDGDRSAAYFYSCNRGKKSVVADLRTQEGLALVRGLAAEADVLVENFKVGGLAKFGLDYEALSARNPRLVYCSITGFGHTGPSASRAGYDFLIQGMSGLMSITGEPEGEPQKVGVAIVDIVTGLYGTIGIQAALLERERTGRGRHIELSLLDCAVAVLANQAMNFLATGVAPGRRGNSHPNIVPYQVFPAADGHIVIATGNDRQYRSLCDVLGLPALKHDPRFKTNAGRVEHREALVAMLKETTVQRTKGDLIAALERAGVPAGPINAIDEVFADPQVIARRLKVTPEGVPGVRSPLAVPEDASAGRTAPRLGQHATSPGWSSRAGPIPAETAAASRTPRPHG